MKITWKRRGLVQSIAVGGALTARILAEVFDHRFYHLRLIRNMLAFETCPLLSSGCTVRSSRRTTP